jgi:hypothetical protein
VPNVKLSVAPQLLRSTTFEIQTSGYRLPNIQIKLGSSIILTPRGHVLLLFVSVTLVHKKVWYTLSPQNMSVK